MPIENINLKKRYPIQLPSIMSVMITLTIGLVIGYLGPFGSFNLPLGTRLSYWVILIAAGSIIFAQIENFCHWYFDDKIKNSVVRFLLPSFIGSIFLSFFVEYISHLFFDVVTAFPENFLFFFPKVFILSVVLNVVGMLINKKLLHTNNETMEKDSKQMTPQSDSFSKENLSDQFTSLNKVINEQQDPLLDRFYKRLPKKLGTELICFSMEDHYLHVHTTVGSHMMLLTMKDALIELKSYEGFQVHRSWWVATDAIVDIKKYSRKAELLMKNDIKVPVSQKYLTVIKELGIL